MFKYIIESASKLYIICEMQSNCGVLLLQIDAEYFKEKVMPAIERSLLRNPEVAIPGLYFIYSINQIIFFL